MSETEFIKGLSSWIKQHFHIDQALLYAVKILNIGTNRSEQTVPTQIRLLHKEQSTQGLHLLQFYPHLLDALLVVKNQIKMLL